MKEGWKKVKLMDNCSVTTGKNDANHAVDNGRYRFYTCASEYLYCNTYKYDGACIILPGNGANVGDVYFYEGKFDAYQRTYVIDNISPKVLPFYLYYQLQYGWKTYGVAKQYGSATNYIKIGNFKDYEFLCPNIDTQKEIVEYLDSSFAKIDKLKENAAKNLEEAKALFQSALKDALEPKEGWEEKTLKEISIIYGNYGLSVSSIPYNGVRYLRITDITENGKLNDDKVSADISSGKTQEELQEGDILFARTGATVGKTLIYKEEFGKCLFAGYLIRYRLNKDIVIPQYIHHFTHSSDYYKWVSLSQKTAAQPNIGAKVYNELRIPIPSLSEQQSIVSFLDSLNEKVNTLQQNYSRICNECDALKQAILRQVFG